MYTILFDLKKEYYFNALWPLYLQMAKDSRYHCKFHVGADHKRVLGLFLIKQKKAIEAKLREKGLENREWQ